MHYEDKHVVFIFVNNFLDENIFQMDLHCTGTTMDMYILEN